LLPGIPFGQVAALEDACWHRLLALSMGRLEGDELACGYHGLAYNARIWPGDPLLADAALIPDLHWNHDPAWAADGKLITVACNYRLVLDNLMDLTHAAFVHGSSVRRAGTAARGTAGRSSGLKPRAW
jgi:vanillate O-demethylase monooxygenase subunit